MIDVFVLELGGELGSEERNRIAHSDTNTNICAEADCDSHAKTEGNAKTSSQADPESNSKKTRVGKGLAESEVEPNEIR